MAKFSIVETIHSYPVKTVRLGQTSATYSSKEIGKAVKLTAESRYELCAAGDAIEGIVSSSNLESQGTLDGYSIGGIGYGGYKAVTFDSAVSIGDYVVVGTVVARGTALGGPLKVTKATPQGDAKAAPFKARVVSLGNAGTGAVGTTGYIEFI